MAQETLHPTRAKEAFDRSALEAIAKTIADVERQTNAEIRVSIRDVREAVEADMTVRELAIREFGTLGMDKTENRTGILLIVLFEERKFYILGDEGVNKHVDTEKWEDVADTLRSHFRKGEYEQGVCEALRKIGAHLSGVLPKRENSSNELSDEVVVH